LRQRTHAAPDCLVVDQSGAVTVEYVVVLAALSVGACVAIATLAALLTRLFSYQQALIALPFP
jgi:Flp pilus assembly pilin Flp